MITRCYHIFIFWRVSVILDLFIIDVLGYSPDGTGTVNLSQSKMDNLSERISNMKMVIGKEGLG